MHIQTQGGLLAAAGPPAEASLRKPFLAKPKALAVIHEDLKGSTGAYFIMHLSYGRPGSLSVLSSCKTRKFRGRRSTTARTPILTESLSRAATGICHGADGMSCFAGRTPSRMSRRTEPTQICNLRAVSSTLIVFSRDA